MMILGLPLLAASASMPVPNLGNDRPNFIIILSDDTGYSDLNCMGGEACTPNLDIMAEDGILFTNCFNNAKSAPTRASLMTGLYNQRVQAYHAAGIIGTGGSVCMAELFRKNGYATICSGKWHIKPSPVEVGFEHHYGMDILPIYYKPFNDNIKIDLDGEEVPIPESFYSVTDYTDYAISQIKHEAIDKHRPFFLYLAYHNVHWPLQAKEETIAKYRGMYDMGSEHIRKMRYRRMVEKKIIDSAVFELCDWNKGSLSWDELNEQGHNSMKERMPIHTASMDEMDSEIGRLLSFLRENNLYENTIIFFLQDNGASGEGGELGDEFKPLKYGITQQGKAGSRESYYRLGRHAATVFNTPLRYYKSSLYNGGCQTPLIVHWPKGIDSSGEINRSFIFISDIAPTCYDIAGIEYPEMLNGEMLFPLDGDSFSCIFRGEELPSDRHYCWKYEDCCSVISGTWKAIGRYDRSLLVAYDWELYDLSKDGSETEDLSKTYPEVLSELIGIWNMWSIDVKLENESNYRNINK